MMAALLRYLSVQASSLLYYYKDLLLHICGVNYAKVRCARFC